MFTGLIEGLGRLVESESRGAARRLGVDHALGGGPLVLGESVALDGVCLTLAARAGQRFWVDVVPQTLARTTLGELAPGAAINLERALALGDRLGGHLVLGHVDGTAVVREACRRGAEHRLVLELPPELARYVVPRGSIALSGVSLTVAGVDRSSFEVALIPETVARTTLGAARAGMRLNVEVDLLARYLDRLVHGDPAAGVP